MMVVIMFGYKHVEIPEIVILIHNNGNGIGTILGLFMELRVLYDDQTVKCALIFTGLDQSSTKMKLLWCSLHKWSTFESGGVWYSLEALQLFKCLSGCCHHCRAAVANRSFMWVYILTILACDSRWYCMYGTFQFY